MDKMCLYTQNKVMGRNRIEPDQLKKRISIRLKEESINKIKKHGTLQEVIEKLVENYLKEK